MDSTRRFGDPLTCLWFGGAVACVVSVVLPLSPYAPVRLYEALAVFCLVIAAMTVVRHGRTARWEPGAHVVAAIALITLLVATAQTRAGVVMTAFGYPWPCIYAAYFLPRRWTLLAAGLVGAGYAIGITVTGEPQLAGAWLVVTASCWGVSAVVASLVDGQRRQIESDALTGLPNRTGLHRAGERVLAAAARRGEPVSVAVLDLDDLKAVNDAGGHVAGDLLLVDAARSWAGQLRAGDVLARVGGDEFVVLLPGAREDQAAAVVARLAAVGVRFSAGVACADRGAELAAVIAVADERMYADKRLRQAGRAPVPPPRRAAD